MKTNIWVRGIHTPDYDSGGLLGGRHENETETKGHSNSNTMASFFSRKKLKWLYSYLLIQKGRYMCCAIPFSVVFYNLNLNFSKKKKRKIMLSPEIILIVKSSVTEASHHQNFPNSFIYNAYYVEIQQSIHLFPLPSVLRTANNGC